MAGMPYPHLHTNDSILIYPAGRTRDISDILDTWRVNSDHRAVRSNGFAGHQLYIVVLCSAAIKEQGLKDCPPFGLGGEVWITMMG